MAQLALPVRLADDAVFASFHPAGNEAVVAELERLAGGTGQPVCWLWGGAGAGKSHLLQAACAAAGRAGRRSVYLPLARHAQLAPAVFDGLERCAFVCADDVDAVAGDAAWERALLSLYEGMADTDARLLVSAHAGPHGVGFALADLRSRLLAGGVYRLKPLPEGERLRALQLRAGRRGLQLSDEVGRYLLRRERRDMSSLYALLEQLDTAALKAQRRLSIPFIRQVLGERPSAAR